ncbi:hypothetical protein [Kitasatospora sp. NPDC088779]|uniref:hypothetical protein n=1 Tax=Kitasatospora sp. NPDC088779 TaxID=3154964 RepID=UPI0034337B41
MASTIALLEVRQPAVQDRIRRAQAELAAATAEQDAITKALEGLRLLSRGGELTPPPTVGAVQESVTAAESIDRQAAPPQSGPAASAARAGRKTAAKKAKKASAARAGTAKTAASAPERQERASVPVTRKAARKAAAKETEPKAAAKRTSTAKKAARAAAAPAGDKPPVKAAAQAAGRRRQVTDANRVLEVLSRAGKPLRAREVTDLLGLDTSEGNINAIRTRLERLAKDGRTQRPGRGLYTVTADRPQTGR